LLTFTDIIEVEVEIVIEIEVINDECRYVILYFQSFLTRYITHMHSTAYYW